MGELIHPLDREGEWEIRISIRRNERTIATGDFLLGTEYGDGDAASNEAATLLQRPEELQYVGDARRWIEQHG